MLHRPDLGFHDEGQDLAGAAFYADALLPVGKARVLPPLAYRSIRFSLLEDETIWTRDWVCVGCSDEIANEGDVLPYTVGNHGIHVQRVDGALKGRFNKAQHGGCRAIPLQCQTGKKTKCSFTSCGYSRDRGVIPASEMGQATPDMEQYLGLRPERLLPVHVMSFGPLMFVNLDVEPPPINGALDAVVDAGQFFRDVTHRADVGWLEFNANWKLLGQHLAAGEPIGKPDSGDWLLSSSSIAGEPAVVAWLFPNLVLMRARGETCVVVMQPTALGQTLCRGAVYGALRDDAAEFWRAEIEWRAAKAVDEHLATVRWGTGLRPDTVGAALPLQLDAQGYWMQRMVAGRAARAMEQPSPKPIYQHLRG